MCVFACVCVCVCVCVCKCACMCTCMSMCEHACICTMCVCICVDTHVAQCAHCLTASPPCFCLLLALLLLLPAGITHQDHLKNTHAHVTLVTLHAIATPLSRVTTMLPISSDHLLAISRYSCLWSRMQQI